MDPGEDFSRSFELARSSSRDVRTMRRPANDLSWRQPKLECVVQLDARKSRRLNFHRPPQIERWSGDFAFLNLITAVCHVQDIQHRFKRADRKAEFAIEAKIAVDDAFSAISAERIKQLGAPRSCVHHDGPLIQARYQ